MIQKSTRWPEDVWSAIVLAAEKDGTTPSELVRVGALSYVAFLAARRQDEVTEGFDRLFDAARELLAVYPL